MRLALPIYFVAAVVTAHAESGAPWNARDPATCTPLVQEAPPSPDQAARLMQCAREDITYVGAK